MVSSLDKSEIAFFDVETTVPTRAGPGHAILEFGAILVCPRKLIELDRYTTLVKPFDLSLIYNLSDRSNGITRNNVLSAPTFANIADKVYDILHGKIWAGHNILRFDCARIREAFAEINRPAPEPKGIIDSLELLKQRFGRRAGDMKMATLASYFDIGQQTHRSLDDVRMNLEVLKYCATVLFLESSLPDIFTENSWVPNAAIRGTNNGKSSPEEMDLDSCRTYFFEPDEISIPFISVILSRFYHGTQKIQILHANLALQVCCRRLKVRFGISKKFIDNAGRPRLSFVVDASPNLCRILDASDSLAQGLSADSGSSSEWRPSVTRTGWSLNSPTVRLHLPTEADGNMVRLATEIYYKGSSTAQRLVFSRFDIEELDSLITPGGFVDAYFSVDTYDYQQGAGIRLVAKKLIIHPN